MLQSTYDHWRAMFVWRGRFDAFIEALILKRIGGCHLFLPRDTSEMLFGIFFFFFSFYFPSSSQRLIYLMMSITKSGLVFVFGWGATLVY